MAAPHAQVWMFGSALRCDHPARIVEVLKPKVKRSSEPGNQIKCTSARQVIAGLSKLTPCQHNIPMLKVIIAAVGILALGFVVAGVVTAHHWNTYRNEEFGFQIKYPAEDFTVVPNPAASPWLAVSPRAEQEIDLVDLHLSSQRYYTKTNLGEASVWIIIDGHGRTASLNCSQPLGVGVPSELPSGRFSEVQEVNGISFTKSLESDAGMSHRYEYTVYSAVHDSKCYRMISFIEYVSMGVFDPGTVSDVTDQIRAKLEEIVKTFRFSTPHRIGPPQVTISVQHNRLSD